MAGPLKPVGQGFHALIAQVARELGCPVEATAIARLASWLDQLVVWNAKVDLTAARGPEELVDLMVADALVLARLEAPRARVVDVGSGAGGPGLGLALLRTDLAITLVEPLQKRVAFLRTVTGNAVAPAGGGGGVTVVRGRGEDLVGLSVFDSAVARATLPPPAWLLLGKELAPGGVVSVLLAREAPPVLPGLEVVHDETYRWPLTGAERRIARYAPHSR